ncbi:Ig-like domain-containing protein [Psychrobacter arenosus]|uniref:Ig-like domain-containing protein n=1 Tax=Psychrobacter arenosus TaxID=256326 RepID=UPI001917BBA7|nr:Ig-like domain-containing protein [Psychrobacter arenosus]
MQTIIVKVQNTQATTNTETVMLGEGQPTVIAADQGVNYEFLEQSSGHAPDHIITQRVANDLHVSFAEDGDTPNLILQDFYSNSEQALMGMAEDGRYYYYIPDTAEVADYVTQLAPGDIEGQALGGPAQLSPWWAGQSEQGFAILPWLVGLAGVGLVAAALADDDDKDDDTPDQPEIPKPILTAQDDGSVTVEPTEEGNTTEITYINEEGNEQTVTFTQNPENGQWVDNNPEDNVTINPETGAVTIPANEVKDGSEVTATQTTQVGESEPATAIAGDDIPQAPIINFADAGPDDIYNAEEVDEDGMITATVTVPEGTEVGDVLTINGTDYPVTEAVIANGQTVAIAPATEVVASITSAAGKKGPDAKDTAPEADITPPDAPTIAFESTGDDAIYNNVEVGDDGTITATVTVPDGTELGDILTINGTEYPVTQAVLDAGQAIEIAPDTVVTASIRDVAGNSGPDATDTAPAAETEISPAQIVDSLIVPDIPETADGGVVINPPEDSDLTTMQVAYYDETSEAGELNTFTLARVDNDNDGIADQWQQATSPDTPADILQSGVSFAAETGSVTLVPNRVRGESVVTVTLTDAAGNQSVATHDALDDRPSRVQYIENNTNVGLIGNVIVENELKPEVAEVVFNDSGTTVSSDGWFRLEQDPETNNTLLYLTEAGKLSEANDFEEGSAQHNYELRAQDAAGKQLYTTSLELSEENARDVDSVISQNVVENDMEQVAFTVTLTDALEKDTRLHLTLSDDSVADKLDYDFLTFSEGVSYDKVNGVIFVPKEVTTFTISVQPISDGLSEGEEPLIFTIADADYTTSILDSAPTNALNSSVANEVFVESSRLAPQDTMASALFANATLIDAQATDSSVNAKAATNDSQANGYEPLSIQSYRVLDENLNANEATTLELVFSSSVLGLELDDFRLEGVALSDLQTSDEGKSWTATVTPLAGFHGSGQILVNGDGYFDANDYSPGVSRTLELAVDTMETPPPEITFEAPGADGIYNIAEVGDDGTITANISVPPDTLTGQTLTVNGEDYPVTLAIRDNGLNIEVLPGEQITASLTDRLGNQSPQTTATAATADTEAPAAPMIAFEPTGDDDIYNAEEVGDDGTITATVTVLDGTEIGDKLTINDIDYAVTQNIIDNGQTFEVTPDTEIVANVTDIADNSGPIADDTAPPADTKAPNACTTTLVIDAITEDNVISTLELTETINITGTVSGEFAAGDQVTLAINEIDYLTTIDTNGRFGIEVLGIELGIDTDTSVVGIANVTDAAGNSGTIKETQDYTLQLDAEAIAPTRRMASDIHYEDLVEDSSNNRALFIGSTDDNSVVSNIANNVETATSSQLISADTGSHLNHNLDIEQGGAVI